MAVSRIDMRNEIQRRTRELKNKLVTEINGDWKVVMLGPLASQLAGRLAMLQEWCLDGAAGYASNGAMRRTMRDAADMIDELLEELETLRGITTACSRDPDERLKLIGDWVNLYVKFGQIPISPPIPTPRTTTR